MITLTLPACQALCDKLTEMGLELPETYLSYRESLWGGHVLMETNMDDKYHPIVAPAITYSEFITDWLPLLIRGSFMDSGVRYFETIAAKTSLFKALQTGKMEAVSSRVIEIIKDLK